MANQEAPNTMPKVTRGAGGLGYKKALRGDVRSLIRIDNPDDAEIARPLGEGDDSTLVQIDNPDDAQIYPADKSPTPSRNPKKKG